MISLENFTVTDQDQVLDFMNKNPFITLIGFDGTFPVATQVPVQVVVKDDQILLIGHVMNKTDHANAYTNHPNVLALFNGPHTYISASVYEQPAAVSTWNYMTVHAKGIFKTMNDDETYEALKNLTNQYENPSSSAAAFHKIGEAEVKKLIKGITGFQIVVTDLKHVFKLSQNKSKTNQNAIIKDLNHRDDPMAKDVADQMTKFC
ncbi:MAG: FMN-binding negative transcriptional regulator [Candidatus Pedobacter colombiensis]|uniref:FMN-binding negative transcriptional regulator n=1 Tax=Candidatus Pedobacter colombiensis TaxID=3121371 RepID=A0AAJ5W5Q0_9SPHI|nr:FMN-binding negative transcriptional regulator [Pedobacter sp.]WEK17444.1 MAG: FMN-binding negative transcriptional regulator [Pedobacter sp.]